MSWTSIFTAVASLLSNFKTAIISGITYWAGKRAGEKDERSRKQKEDLEAIAEAERARRNVNDSDSSVRDDPFNRDNV